MKGSNDKRKGPLHLLSIKVRNCASFIAKPLAESRKVQN